MQIALSGKYGLALEHLAEDTASTPHIDGRRVAPQLKEQLWRTVPPCHDKASIISAGLAVSFPTLWYRLVVVSRKPKIRDL